MLPGATSLGQSRPGSNGNEEVLHIPQSSRSGASPSDCLVSYTGLIGVQALCRDAVYSTAIIVWTCAHQDNSS